MRVVVVERVVTGFAPLLLLLALSLAPEPVGLQLDNFNTCADFACSWHIDVRLDDPTFDRRSGTSDPSYQRFAMALVTSNLLATCLWSYPRERGQAWFVIELLRDDEHRVWTSRIVTPDLAVSHDVLYRGLLWPRTLPPVAELPMNRCVQNVADDFLRRYPPSFDAPWRPDGYLHAESVQLRW